MRGKWLIGLAIVVGCGEQPSGGEDGSTGEPTTSASASMTSAGPSSTSDPSSTSMTPATEGTSPGTTTTDDPSSGTDTSAESSGETTGGSDGPNVDVSDPQLYEFELDPVELDPSVVDNIALQYAHLDTRAEPIGKLVFFLSGYTNTPASWRNHGRQIAGWGFHVVEPHYDNDWSCGPMGGSCNEDTRWEALTGEDTSTVIATSRADSAEGRVVTMLKHLAEVHPGGDWGWYLDDDDQLRYEHVIIAGISHGASSSGLYATRRAFHRVVMHSGGWWSVPDDSATPVSEWYGLAHTDDEQYDGILSAWASAGLPGVPTSIDGATPPYDGAHQLISSIPNGYPHCSVCVHPDSPRDGDDYVYDPAWRTMYGAPQAP